MASSKEAVSGGIKYVNIKLDVIFCVLDFYERRGANDQRVMGTLLGSHDAGGVIEVNACFMVPHKESDDEVAVDKLAAHRMFELHKKANPSDTIVGWFATGNSINEHSLLIHEFYTGACVKPPVHVLVETISKINRRIDVKAFVSSPMGVPKQTLGHMFNPVTLNIVQHSADTSAVEIFKQGIVEKSKVSPALSDIDLVRSSCELILGRLDQLIGYVESVLDGKVHGDSHVGRMLTELIMNLPQVKPEQFKETINRGLKDNLMVLYLAKLIENQISIQDKLLTMALNA
ncbi:eukaryotic translation initiation factor 3 subunit F-like [Symsagittifera roscoffensis]|uniref:eukaryotic translation initiation factor 3 subunit F-like n=1 Tax=Symsagittifera roscoffensis TaxID=84072 RepID=UPI00307CBE6C